MRIDHLATLEGQVAAFYAAVERAESTGVRVPSCPQWMLEDLVGHLGQVHAGWAYVVRRGSETPSVEDVQRATVRDGPLVEWARWSSAELINALHQAASDTPAWCWWAADQSTTAREVTRRMTHETAVHRWDAENTVGEPNELPAEVAVDAIDEFWERMVFGEKPWSGREGVVLLRTHDEQRAWVVRAGAGGPRRLLDKMYRQPNVTIAASAPRLELLLYRRIGLDQVDVEGAREIGQEMVDWPSLG